MGDLIEHVIAMERRIIELERKQENAVRVGRIEEIDASRGLVKVDVGTPEHPLVSGWVPWTERAGGIRTWTPPSPGEQVRLISPTGDMAQGWVDQGGFSNENVQPHDREDERVFTVGETTITETGDSVLIQTMDATVECTNAKIKAEEQAEIETAKAIIKADKVELGDEGGPAVARIGDRVKVPVGSSAGLWPIVEGSSIVNAAG